MTAAVEARSVTKSYESDGTRVDAVCALSLTIEKGEFVAITGPSGSGKSTLLHLLGGLDQPTSGEIEVGGRMLSALSASQRAEVRNLQIGFVFQFFNLLPGLTVAENVGLPAMIAGRRASTSEPRVADLLELVGLGDKSHRFPSQLSGGEQQRVAIARALMMEPAVVLADEPTGNLDTSAGNQVVELLKQCHAAGQTIVLVTHDVRIATQTERVIFVRDGEIVDDTRLETATERQRAVSMMIRSGEPEPD
jgi:putative ABC transport system ATP-binding protein